MKVKNGMSGTGKGRWTTRVDAKNTSRKIRRSLDKKAVKWTSSSRNSWGS